MRQWWVGAGGVRAVTVSICESEMFGKKAPTREWTLEELLDGTVLWGGLFPRQQEQQQENRLEEEEEEEAGRTGCTGDKSR